VVFGYDFDRGNNRLCISAATVSAIGIPAAASKIPCSSANGTPNLSPLFSRGNTRGRKKLPPYGSRGE